MFEELLKASLDSQSEHPSIFHLHKFISLIYSDLEDLREEGYLQVIKQLEGKKQAYF